MIRRYEHNPILTKADVPYLVERPGTFLYSVKYYP